MNSAGLESSKDMRTIRSFVRREGRITNSQKQALKSLMPVFGLHHGTSKFNFSKIFGREANTILEIGFGMGDSLIKQAQENPQTNFLGIDVHRPGIGHFLNEINRLEMQNVRVVCHDAIDVLQNCIKDNSLFALQIFFPDPWPKRRHHKRRLINKEFVDIVARKLKPNGKLFIATDWEHYGTQTLDILNGNELLKNIAADGQYCSRPAFRPLTKFERRGKNLGHTVYDLIFIKI